MGDKSNWKNKNRDILQNKKGTFLGFPIEIVRTTLDLAKKPFKKKGKK